MVTLLPPLLPVLVGAIPSDAVSVAFLFRVELFNPLASFIGSFSGTYLFRLFNFQQSERAVHACAPSD